MKSDRKMRFEVQTVKGTGAALMIVIDKETGVNYLALTTGGITPLLNENGTPIITKWQNQKIKRNGGKYMQIYIFVILAVLAISAAKSKKYNSGK